MLWRSSIYLAFSGLLLARIDPGGGTIGGPFVVARHGSTLGHAVQWTGSAYAIAWTDCMEGPACEIHARLVGQCVTP